MNRDYSLIDEFLIHADLARKTLCVQPKTHERVYPAQVIPEHDLTDTEKKHSAGLMRVNHSGEVCAQALYQGQAITARSYLKCKKRQMKSLIIWCGVTSVCMNSEQMN